MSTTLTTRTAITCRLAREDEGQLVKDLFGRFSGRTPYEWADWSAVSPHWVIAEQDREPVGVLLVGVGRPMGWLECLAVDPTRPKMVQSRIIKSLERAGYQMLLTVGASAVFCTVDDTQPGFQRILEHRQFMRVGHGNFYLKRLL